MQTDSKTAEILKRDLYVDNVLSSFDKETEVLKYFQDSRQLMHEAGMNLCSWSSNSKVLCTNASGQGVLDSDRLAKVLGLRWNPKTDQLAFVKRDIPMLQEVTKRDILRYSSRIYDPLGLLSPVTVRAKLLMQELWKEKFEWDLPLPVSIETMWHDLAKDLNICTGMTFARRYFQNTCKTGSEANGCTQLHIFVDASVKAYGAAAYVTNGIQARIVMAKTRVAPLKSLTLPQLELMAAVVGTRLGTHLKESLPSVDTIYWSDSQIVLHWLTTRKPLKRFVANRVAEILELTNIEAWKYCPTSETPADLLTRGLTANQFSRNKLWDRGPDWILDENKWPNWEISPSAVRTVTDSQVTNEEMTRDFKETTSKETCINLTQAASPSSNNVGVVIDINRYSRYHKLLRVTALVLIFIDKCKKIQRSKANLLTARDLQEAENHWLRCCQASAYEEEISDLKSKSRRSSVVKQLRLYLDENGIIRCGGRIQNASLDVNTKFPMLLPKKHALTKMIVDHVHESHLHSGVSATVTHLRQKYWIPMARQCVKCVIRKCNICRRVTGKPYTAPDPPPLPKVRVQETPPFTVTGVDFTGALYTRDRTGRDSKAYICLFTCAVTRTIHLEVFQDLTEENFVQAFRRFVSRKSLPTLMISDNGTTYTAAAPHLKRLTDSASIKEELTRKGTEWQFIPKRAPWYGGWWERLIGLTKATLKKILGRSYVSLESLQTIVTEVEAVLNDRPLTVVSTNIEDPEPLTPAHLLYGRRITTLPHPGDVDTGSIPTDNAKCTITKRARIQAHLMDKFWRRWRTEYLTALREYHTTTGSTSQTIRVGDVVQVHDDTPRSRWKLAVINELITGNDGFTRAAKIRTNNGHSTRPITKLYPLETVRDSD